MYVCMYVRVCVCVCMCVGVYVCMCVYMYAYMHACMHACMHVRMYVCVIFSFLGFCACRVNELSFRLRLLALHSLTFAPQASEKGP